MSMPKKIETNIRNNSGPNPASQSILLEEYRALNSDYIQQRSEGVTRMNYFISAMSFVLASLVFAVGNDGVMNSNFRPVLLVALIILITVGIDIYNFLIQRNIDMNRDMQGMARIRSYFAKLDSGLSTFFLNRVQEMPTDFLTTKGFGMRRSVEIIVGLLLGFASATVLSLFSLPLEINIVIGVSVTMLIALLLELFARRRLRKALTDEQKVEKLNVDITAN